MAVGQLRTTSQIANFPMLLPGKLEWNLSRQLQEFHIYRTSIFTNLLLYLFHQPSSLPS